MSDPTVPHAAARMAALTGMLLLPLVAMQFTVEVTWAPGDFVAAGKLLFGAGMAYMLAPRPYPHDSAEGGRRRAGIRSAGRHLGGTGRRALPLWVWNVRPSHCVARHLTPERLAP